MAKHASRSKGQGIFLSLQFRDSEQVPCREEAFLMTFADIRTKVNLITIQKPTFPQKINKPSADLILSTTQGHLEPI